MVEDYQFSLNDRKYYVFLDKFSKRGLVKDKQKDLKLEKLRKDALMILDKLKNFKELNVK